MRTALVSALPAFKWVMASMLDLFTSFVGFGYLVAFATGAVTEDAVALTAAGGAVVLALMVGYFAVFARLGGTPWQRVLGLKDATATAR